MRWLRVQVGMAVAAVPLWVVLAPGCGAYAVKCASDDECRPGRCVDGACQEEGTGASSSGGAGSWSATSQGDTSQADTSSASSAWSLPPPSSRSGGSSATGSSQGGSLPPSSVGPSSSLADRSSSSSSSSSTLSLSTSRESSSGTTLVSSSASRSSSLAGVSSSAAPVSSSGPCEDGGDGCGERAACVGGTCYPVDCPGRDCGPSQVCVAGTCTEKTCVGVPPVDGDWGPWTEPTPCSAPCGGGTQSQSRACVNPSPSCGGAPCTGDTTQVLACNTQCCPVDGTWSSWGSWSACSASCGPGTATRTRTCLGVACGGAPCPGSDTEVTACQDRPCDCREGSVEHAETDRSPESLGCAPEVCHRAAANGGDVEVYSIGGCGDGCIRWVGTATKPGWVHDGNAHRCINGVRWGP